MTFFGMYTTDLAAVAGVVACPQDEVMGRQHGKTAWSNPSDLEGRPKAA